MRGRWEVRGREVGRAGSQPYVLDEAAIRSRFAVRVCFTYTRTCNLDWDN